MNQNLTTPPKVQQFAPENEPPPKRKGECLPTMSTNHEISRGMVPAPTVSGMVPAHSSAKTPPPLEAPGAQPKSAKS